MLGLFGKKAVSIDAVAKQLARIDTEHLGVFRNDVLGEYTPEQQLETVVFLCALITLTIIHSALSDIEKETFCRAVNLHYGITVEDQMCDEYSRDVFMKTSVREYLDLLLPDSMAERSRLATKSGMEKVPEDEPGILLMFYLCRRRVKGLADVEIKLIHGTVLAICNAQRRCIEQLRKDYKFE